MPSEPVRSAADAVHPGLTEPPFKHSFFFASMAHRAGGKDRTHQRAYAFGLSDLFDSQHVSVSFSSVLYRKSGLLGTETEPKLIAVEERVGLPRSPNETRIRYLSGNWDA